MQVVLLAPVERATQRLPVSQRATLFALMALLALVACGPTGGGVDDLGVAGAAASAAGGAAAAASARAATAGAPGGGAAAPTADRGGGAAGAAAAAGGSGDAPAAGAGASDDGAAVGGSSGGAASAGAAAVDAGGVALALTPVERDGRYVLEFEDVSFEVDPKLGARVTRYAIAGQNLLTGPEVDATNWGSTFWPSPQARWNWPPVPELDTEAYEGGIRGDAIELTSRTAERVKVQVTKRFRASAAERAIVLEYTLSNRDTTEVSWAGWEISRVAPNGITFFPTGDKAVNTQLAVTNMDAISWYRHDPSAVPMGGLKFSGDGRGGWLAHVAGDALWVKTFDDVPVEQQAPAPEAEIEIYAAAGYVEIEPQGPYTALAPGESLTWSVRWRAQRVPPDVMLEPGNAALVELAESLASE
jgi:Domain of unknown function (DUF4380)